MARTVYGSRTYSVMLYRYMYDITLHGLCPHSGEYCPCRSIRERNSRRRREPKASPFESELSIFSLRKGALRKWYNSLYQSKTSWNDILPDLSRRQKTTPPPTKQKCSRSYATHLFKLQGKRKASVEKSGLFKGTSPSPPLSYTYQKGEEDAHTEI